MVRSCISFLIDSEDTKGFNQERYHDLMYILKLLWLLCGVRGWVLRMEVQRKIGGQCQLRNDGGSSGDEKNDIFGDRIDIIC